MLRSQQPFLANLRTHPRRSAQFHSHSTFRHDSRWNVQTRAAICLLAFCCFWIANNFVNYAQNYIQYPAVKVNSTCRGNYWQTSGWISRQQVQLLIMHCAFVKYLRKKWEYNEAVHQLFIDFKKTYVLFRREVLYNILIQSGIQMKLVRLMKCVWMKCIAESG